MAIDPNEFPEAAAVARRRRLPQLVWLVPFVAAVLGGWLLLDFMAQRGPTVVISFASAEGLEPGKTRIRYKNVDIGEVKQIALSQDRRRVLVTAKLVKQAEDFLAADTRFWVVRPRVSGGRISGLGTLLSGAYIGLDIGKSEETSREFVGLEVAPSLTSDLPGRQFVLQAEDIGSLDIGSPVYYRRMQAGEVVAHELDRSGGNIAIKVFIHAPYDRFVSPRTRFWNASGVDLSLDANGVRLQSQSLLSVILGGIAFETPGGSSGEEEAPLNASFVLHSDRALALKAPDGVPMLMTLNFGESIRGLTAGAPVNFRGIDVGEVLGVGVEYEQGRDWFHFPVRIAVYTERFALRGDGKGRSKESGGRVEQGLLKAMRERGLRAQLRTGNLLTGQLYVALDFFPELKPSGVDWSKRPLELPTVRGNFENLQESLAKILGKLEKLPLDEIAGDLRTLLQSLDHSANSVDKLAQRVDSEVAPEVVAGLKALRATLGSVERLLASDAPLQQDVREALREVARAAQSLRTLADTLERQPSAIIWGKSKDKR